MARTEKVGGEQHKQSEPAAARGVHTPVREDPLMKLLPMDQIWMAMKPGRVEVWAERPPEVSISNLEKKNQI